MTPVRDTRLTRDIDQGWAWVVLVATMTGHVLVCTVPATVGLFQAEFLSHFNVSNSFISLVSSVFLCLQLTAGPIAGVICNIFGIRVAMVTGAVIASLGLVLGSFATDVTQLLATYSIVAGIGLGITYTPLNVVLGHYFHKKRVLANGLATSSCGIGLGLGSSLFVWILDVHGWRIGLTVLGALELQLAVIGCIYFPLDPKNAVFFVCSRRHRNVNEMPTATNRRQSCLWFLGHPYWWILCINYGLQMLGTSIHFVHFPSYALSSGISNQDLQTLLMVFGIVTSLARVLGGFFCNDSGVDLLTVLFGTQCLCGACMLFMPFFAKTYLTLMVYQVVMSLYNGASFVPITPLVAQLFGIDKLATVFGWIMMWGGLGYLTGPVIAGLCYDVSSSYSLGFHIGGITGVVSGFILLLIMLIKVKDREPDRQQTLLDEERTIAKPADGTVEPSVIHILLHGDNGQDEITLK